MQRQAPALVFCHYRLPISCLFLHSGFKKQRLKLGLTLLQHLLQGFHPLGRRKCVRSPRNPVTISPWKIYACTNKLTFWEKSTYHCSSFACCFTGLPTCSDSETASIVQRQGNSNKTLRVNSIHWQRLSLTPHDSFIPHSLWRWVMSGHMVYLHRIAEETVILNFNEESTTVLSFFFLCAKVWAKKLLIF